MKFETCRIIAVTLKNVPGPSNLVDRRQVEAEDTARGQEAHLVHGRAEHIPGLVLLEAHEGVLAVGTAASVGSDSFGGAGEGLGSASSEVGLKVGSPAPCWKCQRQRALMRFLRRSAAPGGV